MKPAKPFQVMLKPVGSACNLDCSYCYYLEKAKLYLEGGPRRMSDEVLESLIRQYCESQQVPELDFVWQGGEPTLWGLESFRKAIELQKRYAGGRKVRNALQTNGTLIDGEWAAFLADNGFLVGLSIDGPEELHDAFRRTKRDGPSFDDVMRGFDILKKHKVDVNALTVVNRLNGDKPLEVYEFLKGVGFDFVQFIPVVERWKCEGDRLHDLASPVDPESQVTDWSVRPEQYGQFLVTIFDYWVRNDVGKVFVQLFDVALNIWAGYPPPLCWFTETCGTALVMEHDGELYSCDHYVYPHFHLGNVVSVPLATMAQSQMQHDFGNAKQRDLPDYCLKCSVKFACQGECPKRRFARTPDGRPGLNYLCAAYKRFFRHVDPYMNRMAELVASHRPAAEIMRELAAGKTFDSKGRKPGPLKSRR